MPFRVSTPPRTTPPAAVLAPPGTTFPRGAKPTPKPEVAKAPKHAVIETPPPDFAIVPSKLDYWGNNQYGDCVSAEEAYAKATYSPEIFIPTAEVIRWAQAHGVLNGAMLDEVLDWMLAKGFQQGSQLFNDGGKHSVDYTNLDVLKSAIATSGCVKIAIAADALPSGAGNQQGWYKFGGGRFPNTDHCVGLSGFGTAGYCFQQLGVPIPSGVDPSKPDCFLLFTWSTLGVVDFPWLGGTCTEAWLRDPTTLGVPPISPPPLTSFSQV